DNSTNVNNLFDRDLDTYFSVHRMSTSFTIDLGEDIKVDGVAIGFFMRDESEERIQTFSISTRAEDDDDDDWKTPLVGEESSGTLEMQTFSFNARTSRYVRFESDGNSFNNWTPLTEVEICEEEGDDDGDDDSSILEAPSVNLIGGSGDPDDVLDWDFDTRWFTENTYHDNDLENDRIHMKLRGDSFLSHVNIAFYDGDLATQDFSIYTQSAADITWTERVRETAALNEELQTFSVDVDPVTHIYVVGRGNAQGNFTKISEVQLYGC
ncbi:unnamed protein product, partial [Sphacelaria rigidula]